MGASCRAAHSDDYIIARFGNVPLSNKLTTNSEYIQVCSRSHFESSLRVAQPVQGGGRGAEKLGVKEKTFRGALENVWCLNSSCALQNGAGQRVGVARGLAGVVPGQSAARVFFRVTAACAYRFYQPRWLAFSRRGVPSTGSPSSTAGTPTRWFRFGRSLPRRPLRLICRGSRCCFRGREAAERAQREHWRVGASSSVAGNAPSSQRVLKF